MVTSMLQVTSPSIPPRNNVNDDDDNHNNNNNDLSNNSNHDHQLCLVCYNSDDNSNNGLQCHNDTLLGSPFAQSHSCRVNHVNAVANQSDDDLNTTNTFLTNALQKTSTTHHSLPPPLSDHHCLEKSTLESTREGSWKTSTDRVHHCSVSPIIVHEKGKRKGLSPTCFSFFASLSASLGSLSMGITLACMNTCTEHISRDINWCMSSTNCVHTHWHKLFIHIAVFVGLLLGSMAVGQVLRYGRRFSLLLFSSFHILAALTCAISTSYVTLMWARFLSGISIGGLVVSVTVYISEVSPPSLRGTFGSLNQIMITFGELVIVSLGNFLHPLGEDQTLHPFDRLFWRFMLGFSGIPAMILIIIFSVGLTFETPQFYAKHGDTHSALSVLNKINEADKVNEAEHALHKAARRAEAAEANGLSLYAILSSSKYRYVLLIGCMVSGLHQVTGINTYISSSNRMIMDTGLTSQNSTVVTTLLMLAHFIFTLPVTFLIERIGRRQLFLNGVFAMTLSIAPGVVGLWIAPGSLITMGLVIAGAISFMIFFSSTYGPCVWVYTSEIFPIEIKNTSTSACASIHFLAAILVVGMSQLLPQRILLTVFCVMGVVSYILIFLLVKETRGRPVDDSPYVTEESHNSIDDTRI